MGLSDAKIAIVHEWLDSYAGSEKVVEQLLEMFPSAELFSIVDFVPDELRGFLRGKKPTTSFIQRLPFSRKHFRSYLPLMPIAIEQFDLSAYDIVISSSHAVAKGVITGPDQLHICYCHSPMRYAWDLQHQYLEEAGLKSGIKTLMVRYYLHKLRIWDSRTANPVDQFVANSNFIARRILKFYGREAAVIHPPVAVDDFQVVSSKEEFYVTASRLVPYKRVDLIVEAFNQMPEKQLYVIGKGPDLDKIKSMARENVHVLGYQSTEVLHQYLGKARAFVFAAEEDFGITPVEAQACGTPVIAYGRGGALDTVVPHGSGDPTGLFFFEQTSGAIKEAICQFETSMTDFDSHVIRKHAEQFSNNRFREEITRIIDRAWDIRVNSVSKVRE